MPVATFDDPSAIVLKGTMNSNVPGKKRDASETTNAEQAVNDALIIVVAAWVGLLLLSFSLRSHNV